MVGVGENEGLKKTVVKARGGKNRRTPSTHRKAKKSKKYSSTAKQKNFEEEMIQGDLV